MRRLGIGLCLLIACGAAAGEDPGPRVSLELAGEPTTNAGTGEHSIVLYVYPIGDNAALLKAGRMTITHATDEKDRVLSPGGPDVFQPLIPGGPGLQVRAGAMIATLGSASQAPREVRFLAATLELVIPSLDPGATVVVPDLPGHLGAPLGEPALSRLGMTVALFDAPSAQAARGAKGGPQDFDAGPMFGSMPGIPSPPPPGFPRFSLEPGDIAVGIDDPMRRWIDVSFEGPDGSPLTYPHSPGYQSSGFPGHEGRSFRVYHLGPSVPAGTQATFLIGTAAATLRVPIHIDAVPAPPGFQRMARLDLNLRAAIGSSADSVQYDLSVPDPRLTDLPHSDEERIERLWADVPEYLAVLKNTPRYTRLPKLLSSVPPEQMQPPIGPHPEVTLVVSFVVDGTGKVEAARAFKSSDERFNSLAVEAVLRWRFSPAETAAGPALTLISVPFVFPAQKAPDAGPGK